MLVIELLLCNIDFSNLSFLAITLRLSLTANAVCACMHPRLCRTIFVTFFVVAGRTQKHKNCQPVCQINGLVISFSHIRADLIRCVTRGGWVIKMGECVLRNLLNGPKLTLQR